MNATVHVARYNPIDRIDPNVYGHLSEHLGRCVYGGIWVGEGEERVPTEGGIRLDTAELLHDLDVPVLRWPGGCFADDYHWRDGVGLREERPRRRNMWWTQGREDVPEESNAFGTEEFMRLCDMLGAEPYLAVNVGSGDPDEAVDWAEYCNYDGDTELTRLRGANGSDDPHDVIWWGVGNENWGCGGRFSPELYAEQFRRHANYLTAFDRVMCDGDIQLVACGHNTDNWNRRFLDHLAECVSFGQGTVYDLLDHLSVHRYYHAGGDTDFTEDQYYRLLARAAKVGDDVDRAAEALEMFASGVDVGIVVDEWGVWHPEAVFENGLEQANTIRDALAAASVFDDLNQRADVVSMANIAQTVNVLQCLVQTDEASAWPTPTYQVFDLYAPHMGATSLRTVVDAETRAVESKGSEFGPEDTHEVTQVSASASETDGHVHVTVSNRELDATREVTISLGAGEPSVTDARVLFAGLPVDTYSTSSNAEAFAPEPIDVTETTDSIVVDIPPSSVVGVTVEVS
ncbi:MAG: alpha-N-arabinofuranosidase [Halodesulfurarchaeum sp.]